MDPKEKLRNKKTGQKGKRHKSQIVLNRKQKAELLEKTNKEKGLINLLIQKNKEENEELRKNEVTILSFMEMNTKLINLYGAEHFAFSLTMDDCSSFDGYEKKELLSPAQRIAIVDSMIGIFGRYDSSPKSIFTAVNILDKYLLLSEKKIDPSNFNSLLVLELTCVFIASKLEDPHPLQLSHLMELSDQKFKKKTFLLVEKEILTTLNFQLFFPDIEDFIKSILFDLCTSSNNLNELEMEEAIIYMEKLSILAARMALLESKYIKHSLLIKAVGCLILGFDIIRSHDKKNIFNEEREEFVDQWIRFFIEKSQMDFKEVEKFYKSLSKFYQDPLSEEVLSLKNAKNLAKQFKDIVKEIRTK